MYINHVLFFVGNRTFKNKKKIIFTSVEERNYIHEEAWTLPLGRSLIYTCWTNVLLERTIYLDREIKKATLHLGVKFPKIQHSYPPPTPHSTLGGGFLFDIITYSMIHKNIDNNKTEPIGAIKLGFWPICVNTDAYIHRYTDLICKYTEEGKRKKG